MITVASLSLNKSSGYINTKTDWANGAGYEYYIGRRSGLVTGKFIAWLDISLSARWLDVGYGTRILSQTILDIASHKRC